MKSTGKKKTSKRKRGSSDLLLKPKRPISAYNYFFREQREELTSGSRDKDGEPKKKLSFEETGRIIGARWRDLPQNELSKYEELAKEDYKRYREEMAEFHKEELALMCAGHDVRGHASGNDGEENKGQESDRKPSAAEDLTKIWQSKSTEILEMSQQQQRDRELKKQRQQQNLLSLAQTLVKIDPSSNFLQGSGLASNITPSTRTGSQTTSLSDDDRKPSASGSGSGSGRLSSEPRQGTGVLQQQIGTGGMAVYMLAQEAAKASAFSMPPHDPAHQLNPFSTATAQDQNPARILSQVQQLVQQQQQPQNLGASTNTSQWIKASLLNEIRQQRAAIKKQQDDLQRESELLRTKESLLEKLILSLDRGNNTNSSDSELTENSTTHAADTDANAQIAGNMNRQPLQSPHMNMNSLQALMLSTFSSAAAAGTPGAPAIPKPSSNTGQVLPNSNAPQHQSPGFGMNDVTALLAQAAQNRPASSTSLGNLHQLLNQLNQPLSDENRRFLAQILAAQQQQQQPSSPAQAGNPQNR